MVMTLKWEQSSCWYTFFPTTFHCSYRYSRGEEFNKPGFLFCQAVWWNEREAKSQKYEQESNQDCSMVFKLWRASQGEELKKKW